MGWLSDEAGLDKCAANYGTRRYSYAQYHARVSQLASALHQRGITPGDVVATLIPNLPAQAEAHFGVPACGAVLNTINTRLDTDTVAYIFDHGEAKIVLCDTQFLPLAEAAKEACEGDGPEIIEVGDSQSAFPATGRFPEYEDVLAGGDPNFAWVMPEDEWESLALNYTSGTTGRPKGVVYHHRGAYLMTTHG